MIEEKSVKLTNRLAVIAEYACGSELVADIGCDHGRLSVALLQGGYAKHVIASDISAPSLEKARLLVKKCGLENDIDIVCAAGLDALTEAKPDTIVIAGMGGEVIASILESGRVVANTAKRIIMQPMRGVPELRKYLHENCYHIERECISPDMGRMYQIICVSPAKQCDDISTILPIFPGEFYEVGYIMTKNRDSLLPAYLGRMKKNTEKSIKSMQTAGVDTSELSMRLACINRILMYISGEHETAY